MDKWILLIFSGFAIFGTIETIRWFLMMQKSSSADVEKTIGYVGSKDPIERVQRANFYKRSLHGLFIVVFLAISITIALIGATVRAFTS